MENRNDGKLQNRATSREAVVGDGILDPASLQTRSTTQEHKSQRSTTHNLFYSTNSFLVIESTRWGLMEY